MSTLTKVVKPVGQYHQWLASDLTNGDIIGVWESLGGRVAHSVTIESTSGDSTVRFNVSKKIYKEHGPMDQWAGMGQGSTRPNPTLIKEIEQTTDNIVITNGIEIMATRFVSKE